MRDEINPSAVSPYFPLSLEAKKCTTFARSAHVVKCNNWPLVTLGDTPSALQCPVVISGK